ncbi:hypothetical protein DMTZ50_0025 [Dehalococcoides mccartyi]|nr:hypothetical protein [Dehalococcoides mccartyi]
MSVKAIAKTQPYNQNFYGKSCPIKSGRTCPKEMPPQLTKLKGQKNWIGSVYAGAD